MKKNIYIYLAGPSDQTEYRKKSFEIAAYLSSKLKLHDPMDAEKCVCKTDHIKIVEMDKKAIDDSDIVIAYVPRITPGTIMEIIYSFDKGKKVYTIAPGKREDTGLTFEEDPWIRYHTTQFFKDIEECFEYIYRTFY